MSKQWKFFLNCSNILLIKWRLKRRKEYFILTKKAIVADLHVHSTASDGLLEPEELIKRSVELGLKAMALTDHDTVDGLPAAREAATQHGLTLIPGIELSCGWEGRDNSIHVLGLFIREDTPEMLALLAEQKEARYHRALKIVQLLQKSGLEVGELHEQFVNSKDKILGRPHIARFLVEKGYIKDFQEAFERYLTRGKPAYVPKDNVLPEKGIEIIHSSGGIAIIAHPGLIPDWEAVWAIIGDMNWNGIETYYSEHKNSEVEKFRNIVEQKGWLSTGGSDYHGDYGKHRNRLGKYGLSQEEYDELCHKCAVIGVGN